MKQISVVLMVAVLAVPAFAHEYWFEPDIFFPRVTEKTAVRLFLGEGLKKEEERPFQTSKTDSFRMFAKVGDSDLIGTDNSMPVYNFAADADGNYLIAMERNWSYIKLESEKFEAYLREDGMEYIIDERAKLGESKKEGRERYSRFIKGLLQVGDKRDQTYKKKTGLKLEIIPLENPYRMRIGDTLMFQVLFDGKPLAGKTVFADNRDGEQIAKAKSSTDKSGKFTVTLNRKGVWLVRLVFMQRCKTDCGEADWESFWGAFSFGVQ